MNPYLRDGRLQDVIAAITAMGTYKFYKLDCEGWADRISGPSKQQAHWEKVFAEHPEFFRMASGDKRVSLVWRRQFPRNFDVDAEPETMGDHKIDGKPYDRISRRPLGAAEITALIGVAVNLHGAALEHANSKRWWVPILIAVLSFVGGICAVLLGKLL